MAFCRTPVSVQVACHLYHLATPGVSNPVNKSGKNPLKDVNSGHLISFEEIFYVK